MTRPPVRVFAACIAVASLMVFVGVLGWGNAARTQAARRQAAKPVSTQPVQVQPQGVTTPSGTAQGGTAPEPVRRHTVTQGDTLWGLTVKYEVTLEDLLAANPKIDPGHLRLGQSLVLPVRSRPAMATATTSLTDIALKGLFAWPVVAPISSYFGPRWGRPHEGIDLAANQGDPIRAARSGEVSFTGTDAAGYGSYLVLKHPDGTRTLYGHCSVLRVRAGQKVKQGDVIALVGSTGHSTGPHLHFEIIVNDKPRDPLAYLPAK